MGVMSARNSLVEAIANTICKEWAEPYRQFVFHAKEVPGFLDHTRECKVCEAALKAAYSATAAVEEKMKEELGDHLERVVRPIHPLELILIIAVVGFAIFAIILSFT